MSKEEKPKEVGRVREIGWPSPLFGSLIGPEDPFRDLGAPFSRMARLFDRGLPERLRETRLAPAVDISEAEGAYVVTAEIPGVKKEDVTVEIEDDLLTIRGEKRSERKGSQEKEHWIERGYGSFSRSFRLPANAKTDEVKASFADGVLRIEVGKRLESKPKPVVIE
jgi:HSP20 family protein